MRETSLTRNEGARPAQRRRILTDDRGTEVVDGAGRVLREFGTDRHAEQVTRHEAEGWRVAFDGDVRPAEAEALPPAGRTGRG